MKRRAAIGVLVRLKRRDGEIEKKLSISPSRRLIVPTPQWLPDGRNFFQSQKVSPSGALCLMIGPPAGLNKKIDFPDQRRIEGKP